MSGVIDTNVLLYAANADAPEHAAARRFVLAAARTADPWYLTSGIVYEFLRVATHPKVFHRPLTWQDAMRFLTPILEADNIHLLHTGEAHWSLLGAVLAGLTHPNGNLFFDIRTVVLMREHGIRRIYTTDTDFLQFVDIEVSNPLRSEP